MKLLTIGMFILCGLLALAKLTGGSLSWVRVFAPLILLVAVFVMKQISLYFIAKSDRKRNLQMEQIRRERRGY